MKKFTDIAGFHKDLFFDGAVQIGWFQSDHQRRDKAAGNFVFHGSEYHGVAQADVLDANGYRLTDTVSFTRELLNNHGRQKGNENPISLAIAGYGTGKSHLALTLATLFSSPASDVSQVILNNLRQASPEIGSEIAIRLSEHDQPVMVIPINGMGNFDLASELSKQAIACLRDHELDTSPMDELWPRFQLADKFVQRNFELRRDEFIEEFNSEISENGLCKSLAEHDDLVYRKVNAIFEMANGYPMRAMGQESPQELLQALNTHYCGKDKTFSGILILFDEFGRYLEFAAKSPHIAGDAALQQIFEGVQDNSDNCSLVCFNQYELKVYLSRISRDNQAIIQRYITRYDMAKKHYLSSNLETLFAHLIEKKDTEFLDAYLNTTSNSHDNSYTHKKIQRWFLRAQQQSVWRDQKLFDTTIVRGCWPLHPLATWFLCQSARFLQQRSAISFVADIFTNQQNRQLNIDEAPWTISASMLCDGMLVNELIATEKHGQSGAVAQSYDAVLQKHENDFKEEERYTLLAVLITAKLGLRVNSQEETDEALQLFSGLSKSETNRAITELSNEYGVLEWNNHLSRYEILGDAIPRSAFLKFLQRKTEFLTLEHIEELFSTQGKQWSEQILADEQVSFADKHTITTQEWSFFSTCTHRRSIDKQIDNALADWQAASKPGDPRGQLLYCYVAADTAIDEIKDIIQQKLDKAVSRQQYGNKPPVYIVLLHDIEGKIWKSIAEYTVITKELSREEQQKFDHFIKDYKNSALNDFKQACDSLKKGVHIYPTGFDIQGGRLKLRLNLIFNQAYPHIIPFPFDGFSTVRGNAASDCRTLTVELVKGSLSHSWISNQNSRVQNRATDLLGEGYNSWGVIDGNGQVMLYPELLSLRQIIEKLHKDLKEEGVLNLGDILRWLIAPPFGLNLASAGLVIGTFLCPRKAMLVYRFNNEEYSPEKWINEAFSKNFFNLTTLKKTNIQYISDSEANEWLDFQGLWDRETTHIAMANFYTQALDLRYRKPLPPGNISQHFDLLKFKTEDSIGKLQQHENWFSKREDYYELARDRQNVANLSRIGKDLVFKIDKMQRESEKWTGDQIENLKKLRVKARTAVQHFFDSWLQEQSCLSTARIDSFRHRMIDQVGHNLRELKLPDLRQKTEEYTLGIISQITERQRVKYIVDEAQAYLNSRHVHGQNHVAELRNWVAGAQDLIPALRQAGQQINAPEIATILGNIENFKEQCRQQITEYNDEFGALWNMTFQSLEDIRIVQNKVRTMMVIFAGDKVENIEDLNLMEKQCILFEEKLNQWNDMTITTSDLEADVARAVTVYSEDEEYEDYPWDMEETFTAFLANILEQRKEAADRWLDTVDVSDSAIVQMEAQNCQDMLLRLEKSPAYLGEQQQNRVEQLRKLLLDRRNGLELDGLLVMYKNLSEELQQQFKDIIFT